MTFKRAAVIDYYNRTHSKLRITSAMNNFASAWDVILNVIVEMTNCVKSHMEFIRYPVFPWSLVTAVPGDHRSTCIIQNGTVTGQVKCNSLLRLLHAAARLLTTSVLSIGALFQANWDVFVFWRNTLCVPLSLPWIVCVLFKNLWYRSQLFPLWFPRERIQYWIFKASHIKMKWPLNVLPSLITTIAHIPKLRITSAMNNFSVREMWYWM